MSKYTVDEYLNDLRQLDQAAKDIETTVERVANYIDSRIRDLGCPYYPDKPIVVGSWVIESKPWPIGIYSVRHDSTLLYQSGKGFQQPPLRKIMGIRRDLSKIFDEMSVHFPGFELQMRRTIRDAAQL